MTSSKATPKTKLTDLVLGPWSSVDAGDNPGAHAFLTKVQKAEDVGQGPSITPATKEKSVFGRLVEWLQGRTDKFSPVTTAEILAADAFNERFRDLRYAFSTSVDMILSNTTGEEMADLLTKSVAEFTAEMRELVGKVDKSAHDSLPDLVDILDSLDENLQRNLQSAEAKTGISVAVDRLKAFDPNHKEGDVSTTPAKKSLEEILKAVPDEAVRAEILAAVAEQKPAPVEDPPADPVVDPVDPDPAAGETAKTLASALKRVAELEEAEKSRSYAAKARELDILGVPLETVAKTLRLVDEDPSQAPLLEAMKALSAQADKAGALTRSVGNRGANGGASQGAIAEAAKSLKAADPKLTDEQAQAAALRANPALYDQFDAEVMGA